MTGTRRIYNKLNLKKTRRNDISKTDNISSITGMTESDMAKWVNDSLRNSVQSSGLIYHPYASGLCMGNCPFCKDPNKDQKHIRKIRKREFQKIVDEEISCAKVSEQALQKEWDSEEEDEASKDI